MSLALASVPNSGTVRPLKPTTKSQEQGQVRVMNRVRNTSFQRMDGNSQLCQKENFCIKGRTSQVELYYRRRDGIITCHYTRVCILPPDNHKDDGGDDHITDVQPFESPI